MKTNASIIVNIILAVTILGSIFFVSLTDSQPQYDPWLDVTDDGYGGIDDIVSTAEHFGASGNPTKPCNITNYPPFPAVTVFWDYPLINGASYTTALRQAEGAKYLHILFLAMGLSGSEQVVLRVMASIYNYGHTASQSIICYTVTLTETNYYHDTVLFVPSEWFNFQVDGQGTTTCDVYLNYYLTW